MANVPFLNEYEAVLGALTEVKNVELDIVCAEGYNDMCQEDELLDWFRRMEDAADELASASAEAQREIFRIRALRRHRAEHPGTRR